MNKVHDDSKHVEKLKAILSIREVSERDHYDADKVLIDFLRENGYNELCELWEEVPKWYS